MIHATSVTGADAALDSGFEDLLPSQVPPIPTTRERLLELLLGAEIRLAALERKHASPKATPEAA